eukprot:scaffold11725_cov116-Cylindrotheca_fusiformis.AAC.8
MSFFAQAHILSLLLRDQPPASTSPLFGALWSCGGTVCYRHLQTIVGLPPAGGDIKFAPPKQKITSVEGRKA